MDNWQKAPAPLKRKVILTVSVGIVCLLIGIAISIYSKDRIMLVLSLAVFGVCAYRAYTFYRVSVKQEYETVEGVCISIVPNPLHRFRKVKIEDEDENEVTLLLNKQYKIKIGERYKFYFKKTTRVTLGNDYLDSALSSDCFIGYEAVSEKK